MYCIMYVLSIKNRLHSFRTMSVLTFQSQNKFDRCAQFLEDLLSKDYQDGNLIMIVTATGSVSISRRLLELTSPLVRDIVASLPAAGVQKHLALILPDTDTSAVNKMMDLLLTGHTTTTDTKESREGVLGLADCLQVMMDSLETLRVGSRSGEIRVRNIQEMLEPNVNIDNNNLSVTEDKDMEEGEEEGDNKTCDDNDKFATLPELGGVAVPVAWVKKIFCDQNADVSSTNGLDNPNSDAAASSPTSGDVLSCTRGSSESGTEKNVGRPYIFRPGHPTPDPRWPAEQQLMIGPMPLSVEYTEARSALMPYGGYILRLFISPNLVVINEDVFKFGYIVYSHADIASRLIAGGFVIVGGIKVAVKKMDGHGQSSYGWIFNTKHNWRNSGQSS